MIYKVKLRFQTGVYIIFLISTLKHRLLILYKCLIEYPQSMFSAEKGKILVSLFHQRIVFLTPVKMQFVI